jgi:hypothetical protein
MWNTVKAAEAAASRPRITRIERMGKILDIFGGRAGNGLVDATGKEIASGDAADTPATTGNAADTAATTGNAGDTPATTGKPVTKGKVGIQGMLVTCACSDGFFRQVVLDGKEARKIQKMIQRMHKGSIRLQMEPVFLVVRQKKPRKQERGEPSRSGGPASPMPATAG